MPNNVVWDGVDPAIEGVVRAAIERLADAGADVVSEDVPEFTEAEDLFAQHGPLVAAEAYARWHDLVDSQADKIYHNVLQRFWAGSEIGVAAFESMRRALEGISSRLHARLARVSALIAPTTLIPPPAIADLEADEEREIDSNLKDALRSFPNAGGKL